MSLVLHMYFFSYFPCFFPIGRMVRLYESFNSWCDAILCTLMKRLGYISFCLVYAWTFLVDVATVHLLPSQWDCPKLLLMSSFAGTTII